MRALVCVCVCALLRVLSVNLTARYLSSADVLQLTRFSEYLHRGKHAVNYVQTHTHTHTHTHIQPLSHIYTFPINTFSLLNTHTHTHTHTHTLQTRAAELTLTINTRFISVSAIHGWRWSVIRAEFQRIHLMQN